MRAGLCTCAGMDAGFRPATIHKRRGDATYDRGNSNMVEAYPDQQTMEGLEKDALPAFVSRVIEPGRFDFIDALGR